MSRKYTRTNYTNIVRGESGTLYLRATVAGQKIFKSLQTRSLDIGARKRDDLLAKERDFRSASRKGRVLDDVTVGQLVADFMAGIETSNLRPSTKRFYKITKNAFAKTVPAAMAVRAANVTEETIRGWMKAIQLEYCPVVHNNIRMVLRNACNIGVQCGIWRISPAECIERLPQPKKEREYPSIEQITSLLEYLGTLKQKGAHYLCRFLCYSGFRIATVIALTPAHVDRKEGVFKVPGEILKTGRDGEIVRFPIFPKMETLLDEMDERYGKDRAKLLPTERCWHVLARACSHLKIPRINHHGFRHVFTTHCILAGVPVPVIAQWRGDHDGGRTLLKVYFHLIDEQSKKFAAQVQLP